MTKGSVLVGYRLFNESFFVKLIKQRAVVGDFSLIHNKVSEFVYKPAEKI